MSVNKIRAATASLSQCNVALDKIAKEAVLAEEAVGNCLREISSHQQQQDQLRSLKTTQSKNNTKQKQQLELRLIALSKVKNALSQILITVAKQESQIEDYRSELIFALAKLT